MIIVQSSGANFFAYNKNRWTIDRGGFTIQPGQFLMMKDHVTPVVGKRTVRPKTKEA